MFADEKAREQLRLALSLAATSAISIFAVFAGL